MTDLYKNDKDCKEITVMTDYSADGLWWDGSAIDIDYLAKEFIIDTKDIEQLRIDIDTWQSMYESFSFWNPEVDDNEIRQTEEFQSFLKLGKKIAKHIRKIIPSDIEVIYFDEEIPARFFVKEDGEFILKERYDK